MSLPFAAVVVKIFKVSRLKSSLLMTGIQYATEQRDHTKAEEKAAEMRAESEVTGLRLKIPLRVFN